MDSPTRLSLPLLCDWQPGAAVPELGTDEARVLRVDLGPRGDDDEPSLLWEWRFLTEDERARALRFVRLGDRRRFVLCRGALRMILGGLLRIPPETVCFRFGPGGKPELAVPNDSGGLAPVRFNLTHSGELALIALSLGRELGVDLERIRSIAEAARIVASYFTPAEQAQFAGLDEEARGAVFLRGWTRKEAILKAKGIGLAGLAASFETMFGTAGLTTQFTPASPFPRVLEWSLWEAAPRAGYVAALAIQKSGRGTEPPPP